MSDNTVIVKVVVSRMPEACFECPFAANEEYAAYECTALKHDDDIDPTLGADVSNMPFRRHDCPLTVEEEDNG